MDKKLVDNLVKTQKLKFYEKLTEYGLESDFPSAFLEKFYKQFKKYCELDPNYSFIDLKKLINDISTHMYLSEGKKHFQDGVEIFVNFLMQFKRISINSEKQYNDNKSSITDAIKKIDECIKQLKTLEKTNNLLVASRMLLSEFKECVITFKNCLSVDAKQSRKISLDENEYLHKAQFDKTDGRKLFHGEPKVSDVKQGQIGDCVLMASLISIVNSNPEYVKNCFIDDVENLDLTNVDSLRIRFFKYSFKEILDVSDLENLTIYPSGPIIISVGIKNILKNSASFDSKYPLWPAILEKAYLIYKKKYVDKAMEYNTKLKSTDAITKDLSDALYLLSLGKTKQKSNSGYEKNSHFSIMNGEPTSIPLLAITGKKLKAQIIKETTSSTEPINEINKGSNKTLGKHVNLSSEYVFLFPETKDTSIFDINNVKISPFGTYQITKKFDSKYEMVRIAPICKGTHTINDDQLNKFTISKKDKSICKKIFGSVNKTLVIGKFSKNFKYSGCDYAGNQEFIILGMNSSNTSIIFSYRIADICNFIKELPISTFLAFLDIGNVKYEECKFLEYYNKGKQITTSLKRKYSDGGVALLTEHEYSVKKIDLSSNKIILVNPHDGSKEIELNFLNFLDYAESIAAV